MSRFVDAYMELWRSPKPVIAQVHGYCVGGGTDFALCSDLIVCAEDCRIGYPPARVWGSPTTSMWIYRLGLERAKRLLLTGDALDGRRAVEWGLASEAAPPDELDDAALALARRVAQLPANQLHMMKLLVNQAYRADGPARDAAHRHAARRLRPPHARGRRVHPAGAGGRRARAVAERDAPFGDYGQRARRENATPSGVWRASPSSSVPRAGSRQAHLLEDWLTSSFIMWSWLRGSSATRRASASAAIVELVAGRASLASPHSTAWRPSSASPVSSRRLARSRPSR